MRDADTLPARIDCPMAPPRPVSVEGAIERLVGRTAAEVERELILHTLSCFGGNRTRAACILGLSVRTLRNKIAQYAKLGIAVPAPTRRFNLREDPLVSDGVV